MAAHAAGAALTLVSAPLPVTNGAAQSLGRFLFWFRPTQLSFPTGQFPAQPSYPLQSPAGVYPQTLPLPPPYTDAPPAYSELYRPSFVPLGAATVPTMSAAYPGASVFLPMAQSVAVGPISSSVPMAYYPVGPVYPPGSTVLVEGGFDAGARFGAGGTASIPPPPPGCPPNTAQLAVMQGANVLVTQRKGNFFLGGSEGGYTIW
ncbi:DAZ-associated protein 2 [Heliangelus exortis]|uniref:DAZ-associated protein 2 n=1 Tax=Heliangelus exortis TaxID=472823 RepID=UPI003A8DB836